MRSVSNSKHGSARDNLAKRIVVDDAIHFYSSLNRETGFLSRNRPRWPSLLLIYTTLLRRLLFSPLGKPVLCRSFSSMSSFLLLFSLSLSLLSLPLFPLLSLHLYIFFSNNMASRRLYENNGFYPLTGDSRCDCGSSRTRLKCVSAVLTHLTSTLSSSSLRHFDITHSCLRYFFIL